MSLTPVLGWICSNVSKSGFVSHSWHFVAPWLVFYSIVRQYPVSSCIISQKRFTHQDPKKLKRPGNEGTGEQNEEKSTPKRRKRKAIEKKKFKMPWNEGPKNQNRSRRRLKMTGNETTTRKAKRNEETKGQKSKKMKSQNARMKGNRAPKASNERKSRPKEAKTKDYLIKAKRWWIMMSE